MLYCRSCRQTYSEGAVCPQCDVELVPAEHRPAARACLRELAAAHLIDAVPNDPETEEVYS